MFVLSGGRATAACPSADLTGDCFVNFEDFAIMASRWIDEGVSPYTNLTRDNIVAMEGGMSTTSIDASDGNEFMPGTYFIYKTDEDRFGRFMVENYELAENHRLTIKWVTYKSDGHVYSFGRGLVIRGTWSYDLDEGLETTTGRDWNWNLQTSTTRRLVPYNGAKFKLMYRADAPDGMEWVYINDRGVSAYEGYMSKYETTNAQYCQFLNAALASGDITVGVDNIVYGRDGSNSGDDFIGERYFYTYEASSYSQITYSGDTFTVRIRDSNDMSNHPVVEVTWYGATAFCKYYTYRLPTELEWRAVADYDGSYTYACGTTIDCNKANYYPLDGDYCNPLGLTSVPYTSPVGYYPSYGHGLNDMAGNVGELTDSCYYGDCVRGYRVSRDGAWYNNRFGCLVINRNSRIPWVPGYGTGFRPVLDLN